ncbi:MAG: DUF2520 domain-containing protein [Deltaproteobacteria bacterium]|nr:DUF2520 domain-containing protein [Deltaproteobacteria bacterium]
MSAAANLVLVGHGRMAAAFERAFHRENLPFRAITARASQWRVPHANTPRTVILAVSDRYIASTCERLVDARVLAKRDVVLHCAGMLDTRPLASASLAGAFAGALHPLVAVASPGDPPPLRGLAATVQGHPRACSAARRLGKLLGLDVIRVPAMDRARYHAAAALCATGGVALAQAAQSLLEQTIPSLSPREAAQMTASLLASVAHNVRAVGTHNALASPLMRGDIPAVAAHLQAMQVHPPAAALYRAALAQVLSVLACDDNFTEAARAQAVLLLST